MSENLSGTEPGRLARVLLALVMVPIAGIPFAIGLAIESAVVAWLASGLFAADAGLVFAWAFGVQLGLGLLVVTPAALADAWRGDDGAA
jgi:hypothetical protein